jgi:hypothetical protein
MMDIDFSHLQCKLHHVRANKTNLDQISDFFI